MAMDVQVNSVQKVRKGKAGTARAVGTLYDSQVMDPNYDVSERRVEPSLQTYAEFPAQESMILNEETLHASEVNDSSVVDNVLHAISNKLSWEPVWDADYQRYYYCNTQTWVTTWDVPEGVEDYNAYIHVGSVESFVNEVATTANPLQEEVIAYESNSLREHTYTEELGSVGLLTNDSNQLGVSIASIGGDLDREPEENSQGTFVKSRAAAASADTDVPISSKFSSSTEPESVDGLVGKVTEADQSTVVRAIVLEETCNTIQDVGSLKSTQVPVETNTKIRYAILTLSALPLT